MTRQTGTPTDETLLTRREWLGKSGGNRAADYGDPRPALVDPGSARLPDDGTALTLEAWKAQQS